jgi:hypothetical protein
MLEPDGPIHHGEPVPLHLKSASALPDCCSIGTLIPSERDTTLVTHTGGPPFGLYTEYLYNSLVHH